MGYNISEGAVEKRKEFLDQILAAIAKGNKIKFSAPNPHIFGYQIREAIRAAQELQIEPYASLSVRVSVKRDHVLVTGSLTEEAISAVMVSPTYEPEVVETAITEFDVIQAVLARKESARLRFPNFSGRLRFVEQWAERSGYTVTLPPLTLTKKDEVVS